MPRKERRSQTAVVLADVPERVQLRRLRQDLEDRRDAIADLDLEIETLREDLASFEASYDSRLSEENGSLRRIESLVRHLERCSKLLEQSPRQEVKERAQRLRKRRETELKRRPPRHREARGEREQQSPATEQRSPAQRLPATDRLKNAYRALARRFHPDLARTEQERLRNSEVMARINTSYRTGDVERLEALAEQAKGGHIEDSDLSATEQVDVLTERLAWFEAVLENLGDERAELERTPTCTLWRNIQQAEAAGHDIYAELRQQLSHRISRSYRDVRDAIETLEQRVAEYNRHPSPSQRSRAALAPFDPLADHNLVQAALDELDATAAGPAARRWAAWLEETAAQAPRLIQLILLAWVAELSPLPLKGLERFEDLEQRVLRLTERDVPSRSLAELLVDADDLVELGVKEATATLAHVGLRFRERALRGAVPVALRSLAVRRLFGEVLTVLGERHSCTRCSEMAFAVPLYQLRGLDNLHATVCPACGHTLSRYWMPRGKSIQMLLNPAYVDHEIVSEYRFALGRTSVATQLVPAEVEHATIGDLKKRLHRDLFARHDLPIRRGQLRLFAGETRLTERTPLLDFEHDTITIRFAPGCEMKESDAVEVLRHRIRERFRC